MPRGRRLLQNETSQQEDENSYINNESAVHCIIDPINQPVKRISDEASSAVSISKCEQRQTDDVILLKETMNRDILITAKLNQTMSEIPNKKLKDDDQSGLGSSPKVSNSSGGPLDVSSSTNCCSKCIDSDLNDGTINVRNMSETSLTVSTIEIESLDSDALVHPSNNEFLGKDDIAAQSALCISTISDNNAEKVEQVESDSCRGDPVENVPEKNEEGKGLVGITEVVLLFDCKIEFISELKVPEFNLSV